jgi:chromosome segregation ATPase
MDNEKFQDLMLEHFGKVLNKLDGVESRLGSVESRLGSVESRLSNVESELSEVKQSQTTMEIKFGEKLDALYYDWRDTQKQLNEAVKTEIKNLGTKVEALQMESTRYDQEIKDLTESKFYLVKAPKE